MGTESHSRAASPSPSSQRHRWPQEPSPVLGQSQGISSLPPLFRTMLQPDRLEAEGQWSALLLPGSPLVRGSRRVTPRGSGSPDGNGPVSKLTVRCPRGPQGPSGLQGSSAGLGRGSGSSREASLLEEGRMRGQQNPEGTGPHARPVAAGPEGGDFPGNLRITRGELTEK